MHLERKFEMLPALAALLLASAMLIAPPQASARRHHQRYRSHHPRRHHHRRRSHAAGANCANADTPAIAAASKQEMRDAVVCLINAQRTSRGLPALSEAPRLDHSAQLWTGVMVNSGVFSHGSDFASRITNAGYRWWFAGENIAAGFETPRDVVSAWMGSPDHCRNILDPNYADVGTGVSTHRLANIGPATWTQDFGLWSGHQPPSGNTGPQDGCPY